MKNKIVLIIILLALLPCSQAWAGNTIAVLLSDSEEAYNRPVVTFSEGVDLPVQVFNLRGDIKADPRLKEKLLASDPALIFALGAKAAYVAKLWTHERQDIPVLFAMVLNWQHYKLLDQGNMAGIAAEMAPGTQFVNMTMVAPDVEKIGIVVSQRSAEILVQASKAADLLGLELVTEIVERSQDFKRAFKKISGQVDAYWVVNDPVVYTLANIDWLERRCIKEKVFCLGQSANIAQLGLVMAINPDLAGIGSQAASLVINILARRQSPAQIGVMPPLATQILLNRRTSQRIGLALSSQALNLVTTVVE